MVVTSMVLVGLVAGLLGVPLGMVAHRLVLPAAAAASRLELPGWALSVWSPPVVVLLALGGLVIALLGALLPARGAAQLRIAEVLHRLLVNQ